MECVKEFLASSLSVVSCQAIDVASQQTAFLLSRQWFTKAQIKIYFLLMGSVQENLLFSSFVFWVRKNL